jgi:hypothetical protein
VEPVCLANTVANVFHIYGLKVLTPAMMKMTWKDGVGLGLCCL